VVQSTKRRTRQQSAAQEALRESQNPVIDTLRADQFLTRSDLGQHFLRSVHVATRLIALADLGEQSAVLEVGAGLGTLSRAVAGAGHRVWAVEKDSRLGGILGSSLAPFAGRAHPLVDDVRALDLDLLLPSQTVLVSILPFDWELACELTRHVFATSRHVVRGLAVIPQAAFEHAEASEPCLRLREVDGISRGEFWPEASVSLRVVSIERC
jgi:16S rRNA (adenine1518-N6/adenine1519-N6)-dimethyltransferase